MREDSFVFHVWCIYNVNWFCSPSTLTHWSSITHEFASWVLPGCCRHYQLDYVVTRGSDVHEMIPRVTRVQQCCTSEDSLLYRDSTMLHTEITREVQKGDTGDFSHHYLPKYVSITMQWYCMNLCEVAQAKWVSRFCVLCCKDSSDNSSHRIARHVNGIILDTVGTRYDLFQ